MARLPAHLPRNDLEEQRALMRHEDIRTTLDYGGKTPAESLRGANAKVVEMLKKKMA